MPCHAGCKRANYRLQTLRSPSFLKTSYPTSRYENKMCDKARLAEYPGAILYLSKTEIGSSCQRTQKSARTPTGNLFQLSDQPLETLPS